MEISGFIVRRMDNYNIVVHRNLGKNKRDEWNTDETMTYHANLVKALRNVRTRLQQKGVTSQDLTTQIKKIEDIDKKFFAELELKLGTSDLIKG